jgi:hypothetical protein
MTDTPRLALPLIEAAQAQKHVTHNEALLRLDAEIQLAVIDRDLAAPPSAPADGDLYIVAPAATGAWAGYAGAVAAFLSGAWIFLAPRAGWLCWVADENRLLVHDGSIWRDFADRAGLVRASALADGTTTRLGINTAADASNRFAVKSDAVLLAADDVSGAGSGDIRVALAKTATARDAALQFETAWSSRALFGLLGGDDVSLKVSPDGATWTEALHVAAATGRLTLPAGGLAGGGRLLSSRLVTASGTWTCPAGVRYALVWALGAGGGGGGAAGAASSGAAGGGGGAGGLALAFLDVSAIASRAVTIGAGGSGGATSGGDGAGGGSTSFGSDVVAAGGGGGKGMSAGTFGTAVTGGLGGTTSAGDTGFTGAPGSPGLRFDGSNTLSGNGGASYFGGGARGNVGNVAGGVGSARGSGGAGASVAASATGLAGGAGGAGFVWIWEFE